jgi:hypothetical protein
LILVYSDVEVIHVASLTVKTVKFWSKGLKGHNYLGNIGMDERIILKWL